MNDPTPAEREALGARLTAAIPTEPELIGLAGRVERGARRHRRVRRAGVAGVAAVAVAVVIAVPQWLGSQPRHEGSPPTPSSTHVPAHPCSGRPDHRDFTHGTAAWVTFCFTKPSGGDTEVAHYPRGVLVTGAASLVGSWQDGVSTVQQLSLSVGRRLPSPSGSGSPTGPRPSWAATPVTAKWVSSRPPRPRPDRAVSSCTTV